MKRRNKKDEEIVVMFTDKDDNLFYSEELVNIKLKDLQKENERLNTQLNASRDLNKKLMNIYDNMRDYLNQIYLFNMIDSDVRNDMINILENKYDPKVESIIKLARGNNDDE